MAFLAFWDSFQFRNVYILCNLFFFAFHLYVKEAFKKSNKPIKRLTFPSKHSGCAKTYVRLPGIGWNVVQTCKPLSWLVHGTSAFLTRKKHTSNCSRISVPSPNICYAKFACFQKILAAAIDYVLLCTNSIVFFCLLVAISHL